MTGILLALGAAVFAYDGAAPLDVRTLERQSATGASVLSISYSGARGPVSASLVVPANSSTGKHPAVVFMHDSGHKREEFVAEAVLLARASPGFVSLLIDAPAARPPGWRRDFNSMIEGNDRDIHIQAVVDIRRGIDVLEARPDVDSARIAYVGHGYGANWGAILSAVEPRLRALALIAGIPSLTAGMSADDPEWANMRYAMGEERFAQYLKSISVADAIGYIGQAKAPVLLQFGRFDPFVTRAMADELSRAVVKTGRTIFYDAGHEVNAPQALLDRAAFLRK